MLAVSLLVGIVFYMTYNKWTIGSATFCATSTLIGSIYGVPNQKDNVGAAFTILYYVYGISLFTAIIGAIIGGMITRAPLISAQARRKIAEMEQPEDTDGDGEIGLNDYCFFLWVRFLDLIGWEEYQLNYLMTGAAFCWVVVGVFYGMYIEGWNWDDSIYFAMNAVSMAALANPPCENGEPDDCDVGFYRGLALSAYLLIGVPLFTLALAQLAGLVIYRAVRENEYKIIHQPLTQDEYDYAANLYGNDEVLSLGEFTVLELLRLQRVSMEDLEHIKNLFCAIDEAETGIVDKPMLARRNLIQTYGSVDFHEQDRGGWGRDRTSSNASSRAYRGRARTRSHSMNSHPSTLRRKDRRDSSPPLVKIPSVIFDEERGDGDTSTSADQREEVRRGGDSGKEGGSERSRSSSSSYRSSVAVPEIPVGIKRMTIAEYNQHVVPLAFTTLIENYEEELEEGEGEEDEDDLSSRGFNTAAEEEDEWPSDTCGAKWSGGRDKERDREATSAAGFQSGFRNLLISESEREEEDEDGRRERKRSNTRRLRHRSSPRKHHIPSRHRTGTIREGGGREVRDLRDASDIEKGYKSEF